MSLSLQKAASALSCFRCQGPTVREPARLRELLVQLIDDNFQTDCQSPYARKVVEFLFDPGKSTQVDFTLLGSDALYLDSLLSLKTSMASAGATRPPDRLLLRSGVAQDCLTDDTDSLSIFKVLNLAVLAGIPAIQKTAIVTSVRNEGLSILEWLAHHRATGFDKFYIFTNDNTDGSDELLQILAHAGVISLIENEVGPGVKIQAKVLEYSLHLLPELRNFEWAFYIDSDEFFISHAGPELSINSVLRELSRTYPDSEPSALSFNWKWFGSEDAFKLTGGFLMKRFIYSIDNEHVKSMVRLRDVISMHKVHCPVLVDGCWLVNANFERVDASIHLNPAYRTGQLNHYWNKSFQEFVLKRARGRISTGLSGDPLEFSSFFDWGSNGRRGNLDSPNALVLERLGVEYERLLMVDGVSESLKRIKHNSNASLANLHREFDLQQIYRRRGRSV